MGAEGEPHGVSILTVATCVNAARDPRPVPPITATRIGSYNALA